MELASRDVVLTAKQGPDPPLMVFDCARAVELLNLVKLVAYLEHQVIRVLTR